MKAPQIYVKAMILKVKNLGAQMDQRPIEAQWLLRLRKDPKYMILTTRARSSAG